LNLSEPQIPIHPLPIQLIVGLGNPGKQYADTRHNVGAWFIEALSDRYKAKLQMESKFHGLFGTMQFEDASIGLVRNFSCKLLFPSTFMNLSGKAVQSVLKFYKIPATAILVVHDELDFLPGIARLKFGGGDNGHNGLIDIIKHTHTKDFCRLRVGIGKPKDKNTSADYVLNSPNKSEREQIDQALDKSIAVLPYLLQGDLAKAMQELHS
jgi:peptidyl-tRNA hydrolase, PTH1 family